MAYTLAHDYSILICFGVMLVLLAISFFSIDLVYRSKIMLGFMGLFFIAITARYYFPPIHTHTLAHTLTHNIAPQLDWRLGWAWLHRH